MAGMGMGDDPLLAMLRFAPIVFVVLGVGFVVWLARQRLPDDVHREHVRVFEAIRAGDSRAARIAATSHLRRAAARLNLPIPGRDALTGAAAPNSSTNKSTAKK